MTRTRAAPELMKRWGWATAAGFSFWLPASAAMVLFPNHRVVPNIAALIGVAVASVVARSRGAREVSWLWALVGIYCVGPTMMLAAGAVTSPPSVAGDAAWMAVFSLLPPMTPWLALLNGLLEAVLLVTAVLLILAARQYDRWRAR